MQEVLIFGHKKPDTDSVTAAIALAYYKRKIGINANPYILSHINRETEYVLKKFGFNEPEFLNDTKLQIKDINYHKDCIINEKESIYNTYKYMINKNITGIPLVDDEKKFKGIVTTTMILKGIVDGNDILETSIHNLTNSLNASIITNFNIIIKGKITVNEKFNKDSICITDNQSLIKKAIEKKVKLLVLTNNIEISKEFINLAKENKLNIIKTHLDYFTVHKNIHLSKYIKTLITEDRFEEVNEDDYYDDFVAKSTKLGYNNYPVINKEGTCKGLLRITDRNKRER